MNRFFVLFNDIKINHENTVFLRLVQYKIEKKSSCLLMKHKMQNTTEVIVAYNHIY